MAEPGAGPRIDAAGRATSGWISSTPQPVAEEFAPVTSAIKVVSTQGAENYRYRSQTLESVKHHLRPPTIS